MSELAEIIEQTQTRFSEIAPSQMRFEAEKGFAIQLLQNNEFLMKAARSNPKSMQQALTNVAAIGLSLNPAKKEAYLITRNMKVKRDGRDAWETRVFLEPSYMGLCNIATSSGRIEWIQAQVVREKDTFVFSGVGEKPQHSFNAFKDRGEIVGVYAVAKTNQGDFLCDTMDLDKINSIMNRSESIKNARKNNKPLYGPWVTDFEEMTRKSMVRLLFKMLPKTGMESLHEAVHLSNENEGFEPIQTAPELFTGEKKEHFDDLIKKSDALGMYAFSVMCSESELQGLYHSFEKGTKGRYQAVVDKLISAGNAQCRDYADQICKAIDSDDAGHQDELMSELVPDEFEAVFRLLPSEYQGHVLANRKAS